MLIDWFTVGAQVLNFLILVWLLRRYLYQPILQAIDTREKLIAGELAGAAEKMATAQKEKDEFAQKNTTFDAERADLLSKATGEANAKRQEMLDEARKSADALGAKRREAQENDARNLHQALNRRAQEEVFAITRKTLLDLADANLEERATAIFIQRLRDLTGPAKTDLASALTTATKPALVRSAFDLPEAQRATIQTALNETFSADIPVNFQSAPDLISGIELSGNGQEVAWNIADYLTSLEKSATELLNQRPALI